MGRFPAQETSPLDPKQSRRGEAASRERAGLAAGCGTQVRGQGGGGRGAASWLLAGKAGRGFRVTQAGKGQALQEASSHPGEGNGRRRGGTLDTRRVQFWCGWGCEGQRRQG